MQVRMHEIAIRLALVLLDDLVRLVPVVLGQPPQGLQGGAHAGGRLGGGHAAAEFIDGCHAPSLIDFSSSRDGKAANAPGRVAVRAAAFCAMPIAASTDAPSASAAATTPQKVSPQPVVSTAAMRSAGKDRPPSLHPSAPRVTMAVPTRSSAGPRASASIRLAMMMFACGTSFSAPGQKGAGLKIDRGAAARMALVVS